MHHKSFNASFTPNVLFMASLCSTHALFMPVRLKPILGATRNCLRSSRIHWRRSVAIVHWRRLYALSTHVRRSNSLIGIRGLFSNNTTAAASTGLARATTRAKCPEQATNDRKARSEPDDCKHTTAQSGVHLVIFEIGIEKAVESGVESRCCDCCGKGEEGRDLYVKTHVSHKIQKQGGNAYERTPETKVVTQLPNRLKMAEMPTSSSATAEIMAIKYAINIHLAAFS